MAKTWSFGCNHSYIYSTWMFTHRLGSVQFINEQLAYTAWSNIIGSVELSLRTVCEHEILQMLTDQHACWSVYFCARTAQPELTLEWKFSEPFKSLRRPILFVCCQCNVCASHPLLNHQFRAQHCCIFQRMINWVWLATSNVYASHYCRTFIWYVLMLI